MHAPPTPPHTLTLAWLVLVALTLASLAFGQWGAAARWLPLLVAVLIWVKCAIVAHHFIESHRAPPFIRRLVVTFMSFAPVSLVLVTFYGEPIGRWLSLD